MSGWARHKGPAALIAAENVDTDRIIPARFMATPRAEGYGRFLFHDDRVDAEGRATRHPLNDAAPTVLVAGRNFGSGSSREAAVYALVDYGIRAVLAPSFGDIFASNAVNNGLLPGRIDVETLGALTGYLAGPARAVSVDLDDMTLRFNSHVAPIALDPVWRTKLMNGWDDIDLTATHADAIANFARARRRAVPWSWPARAS
jgi:3-isopropylmalate/(R)-2-methylmalate dehydratase small subunit